MAATASATDTLDLLEERIQRTVALVTTLRDERDMARLETSEALETNTRLSAELEALRADSESRSPANPAKVANLAPLNPERFADSQDSQRIAAAIRAHLLTLAATDARIAKRPEW